MKQPPLLKLLAGLILILSSQRSTAQLQVTEINNAQLLAQKLVGDGVIISNATLTNSPNIIPTGFFLNQGGTNINIDSGIVLTCGRAKSDFRFNNRWGVDCDGSFAANTRRA